MRHGCHQILFDLHDKLFKSCPALSLRRSINIEIKDDVPQQPRIIIIRGHFYLMTRLASQADFEHTAIMLQLTCIDFFQASAAPRVQSQSQARVRIEWLLKPPLLPEGIRNNYPVIARTSYFYTSNAIVNIEAMNKDEEEFDEPRLLEILKNNQDKNSGELIEIILNEVNDFAKGQPQSDDMTIVVVKRL